jgi:hypothetical protein
MMQSRWTRFVRHCALVGAIGLALSAATAPGVARADDDDPDDNPVARWERKFWNGIVRGLGLKGDEPSIDYRERSPLVVPPSRDLPPPQAKAGPRDPAWPVDPDAKRAKDLAAAKKKRNAAGHGFDQLERRSAPIPLDELNPPGTPGAPTTASDRSNAPQERQGDRLLPSELGYSGGLFSWSGFGFGPKKPEVGTFTREPPRTDLTAPPTGYQTPSAAQPYGVTPRVEYGRAEPHDPARGQ